MLVAAVIGGILVLGGGFGLYQAGLVKLTPEPDPQMARSLTAAERKISELERKLADVTAGAANQNTGSAVSALETKVSSLESRLENAASTDSSPAIAALQKDIEQLRGEMASAPAGSGEGAPADIAPLEERLSKLENTISSTSSDASQLSGSVSGIEGELNELKTSLGEVQTRLENTEATAKAAQTAVSTSDVSLKTLADSQARATETLSSLSSDIKSIGEANTAALEDVRAELDAISKRLAQVESTMGDATAREVAARALSVSALKSAVDSGRAYETELAAVKAGLPEDMDLSALEANAKTGVEPASVLIAQFPAVAREMHQTFSKPDPDGDVLDSLLSSARSIVSVRGPGDADGSGPEAALRRMENAVASGDLNGALAAYETLPEAAQEAGADWATRARARVEVNALTDKATQELLDALAAKDS